MKNLIIGYGETLTEYVDIKTGSGEKAHPYSFAEARNKLVEDLTNVVHHIKQKPAQQCANGEVVIKFVQHPSYLAKTYYPTQLFKKFNVKDVGSKSVRIKPRKWAIQKHPEEGLSSCIFVSGTASKFEAMLNSIAHDSLPEKIKTLVRSIENVNLVSAKEKIRNIENYSGQLKLEVVLHAEEMDEIVLSSFTNFVTELGGTVDRKRSTSVGGLTFVPVYIPLGLEAELAEFSQLRVLRSIPKLRTYNPDAIRTNIERSFKLPDYKPLSNDFKVCIFDGGLGEGNLIESWVKEIIPNDVKRSHPGLLAHGGEVCSTYLFGPVNEANGTFMSPYTDVDIVRVLSPDDKEPDLFDVLRRIKTVLQEKKYKFINLSMGPRLPVEDDDVHVWTSVIDSLLQDGHCLATVAIGNDGDLDGEYSRIQPPSDMVNCFAIGSNDTMGESWKRAEYSCKGPGRSPGVVKPDGVIFGGSESELFQVYSPRTDSVIGTQGTSYSAPYALRVAAGLDSITDIKLSTSAIKALMIHRAERSEEKMVDVGWGRLPSSPEGILECKEDEATIIYQGELKPSQHMRIPIPVPEGANCTWIHLKATFCFNASVDPEHPLHYTRSGLVVTFRPNEEKVKEDADHANTKTFFSVGKLYQTEEDLREDAHKWETCISKSERFKKSTLSAPVFDVKYHAREKGADPNGPKLPLKYSLILSIRAEGETETYNMVLQQNQTLEAVKISNRVRIQS